MDLLVHVVITSALAIWLAATFGKRNHALKPVDEEPGDTPSITKKPSFPVKLLCRLEILGNYADLRVLLVGSLLPDIIDKPLGYWILQNTFNSGRIFAHTLLFLIVLTVSGWIIYRNSKRTWMLVLAFGTLIHFLLDGVWTSPESFFWPVLGVTFPRSTTTNWWRDMFNNLTRDPATYITEIIGLIIVAWFVLWLARKKQLRSLIMTGRVKPDSRCSDAKPGWRPMTR